MTHVDNLRQQKQQRLTNEMVLSDLNVHENKLHRQHTKIEENSAAQQADFEVWHQIGGDLLDKQQQATKCTSTVVLSQSEVIARIKLSISATELENLLPRYSDDTNTDFYFNQTLTKFLDNINAKKTHSLKDQLVQLQGVNSTNLNKDLIQSARAIYELSNIDSAATSEILAVLSRSDPTLRDLHMKLDRLVVQRNQALNEREDMATAEVLHNEMDDVLQEVVETHLARLTLLIDSAQGQSLVAQLATESNSLAAAVEAERDRQYPLCENISSDLDNIDAELSTLQQQIIDKRMQMQKLQGACKVSLIANAKKQNEVFQTIRTLYQELTALGDERSGLINDLKHEKVIHEEQILTNEATQSAAIKLKETLQELLVKVQASGKAFELVEDFAKKTQNKVQEATNKAKQETEYVLLRERREFYSQFTEYYSTLGDLLFAKECRLQELDGHTAAVEHLRDMSKTTLDPKKADYLITLRDLEKQKQILSLDISNLKARADQAAEDAASTEEELMKHGDKIVSPVIELQEKNSDRHLEVTAMRKQRAIQTQKSIDHHEEKTTSLRQLALQARSTGMTCHMRPLSPEGVGRGPTPDERKQCYVQKLRRTVENQSQSYG